MKTLSAALQTHFAQQTTSIVTCWRATRTDGQVFGFTNHDQDVDFGGVIYYAKGGYTRTDIANNSNLDVDNNDIDGLFDSDLITENDLRAGLWDGCQIEEFEVNWRDLSMGRSHVKTGRLGRVTVSRGRFHVEFLGMSWAFGSTTLTEVTQPGCRATFGDQRCKLNIDGSPSIMVGVGSPTIPVSITYTGTVDSFDQTANAIVDVARTQEDGFFNFGKVTMLTGQNAGRTFEVRYYTTGNIALQVIPYPLIEAGDQYRVQRGCDKKFSTCIAYGNQVNFRGEPHLQGEDLLIRTGRRT